MSRHTQTLELCCVWLGPEARLFLAHVLPNRVRTPRLMCSAALGASRKAFQGPESITSASQAWTNCNRGFIRVQYAVLRLQFCPPPT